MRRVPVWTWRLLMLGVTSSHPRQPPTISSRPQECLPVYVYFHGGGWTSGDKSALTKYCANQAAGGIVVVNVNYRKPPRFYMGHVLEDANAALAWVRSNIEDYGGDPESVVLGGGSAGGQIAALADGGNNPAQLAGYYSLQPALAADHLRGLVQHCSVVDFSVFFQSGSGRRPSASQTEWLDGRFPPVFRSVPASEVYRRLHAFVRKVAGPTTNI
ncbi:alpha/beta hydrolase [Pseudarthrobacter sp. NamB4]|nr:alpha/beta hydrolase [Pseudarthrobacter sp. NamB4]